MNLVSLSELVKPAGKRAGTTTGLPVYSVTKHAGFVPSLEYFKKQVFSRDLESYKLVEPGDFAYATIHLDEGSVGIAPERGLISPMYTVFKVDDSRVDPWFLLRFLKSPRALVHYPSLGKGAIHRRKAISLKALGELRISLPALHEQRRIAAILDQADALRAKRRQVLDNLDALTQSIFHDMFGRCSTADERPLSALATVTSGITKGRRTSDATFDTPYLAVSNVQAGHLVLDVVKEIGATEAEIQRYALAEGDLVLTEGGDPDKLGRGTVWRNQLPLCLHQNHIFRVRIDDRMALLPEFLSGYLNDSRAKRYFLRSAKQTTGIASINMTQLKALPVPVPPMIDQQRYLSKILAITNQIGFTVQGVEILDALLTSLQSRAFPGEL